MKKLLSKWSFLSAVLLLVSILVSSTATAFAATDVIPPVTTVTFTGEAGDDGWYHSDVQVMLTAVDNPGGSGVNRTEYSFDGTLWTRYTGPFTITGEGLTTFYYRSVDNAGNVEVLLIPGFHQVSMTGVFNSDAYTIYQNYETYPRTGYYRIFPGTIYADPVYGNVPMDMKPKGTNNVWLSKGLERTVSFPMQLTLNMNVQDAKNIWVVGLDGGWVFGGTRVDIRYTVDGITRTATYYPNDWCYSGTGAGLRLWASGDHADIAVARIDLPAAGRLTNVTIVDVGGSAQASIPVFAVTVRYENLTFKSTAVKIDKTAPTLTFADPTPAPNPAGWRNSDVSIAFSAADNLSGVASTTPSSPLVLTTEGDNITTDVTVTDLAGNSATFNSPPVKIDKTAPVITINAPAAQEYSTSDTIAIDYAVADGLSGVESVMATIDGIPVNQGETVSLTDKAGGHTFAVTCTDVAGNTATNSVTFSVVIAATVDINPDTLNTKSKGNPVTAYIEFPKGYDVAQIDIATVKLNVNGTEIVAQSKPTAVGDCDNDGITDLMVKFDREAVIAALDGQSGETTLTITGVLTDGRKFMGTDTIRVLNK